MGRRFPVIVLLLALALLGACSSGKDERAVFLGASAKAFVDVSGTLELEEVSRRRDELFRRDMDVVRYAQYFPAKARIWIAVPMPDISSLIRSGWRGTFGIVLKEPRVSRLEASAIGPNGTTRYIWDWSDERRQAGNGYRYPFIGFEPKDLEGAVVFLRVATRLPFHDALWLTDFQNFFGHYNAETMVLSIIVGVKVAMLLYILTLALSLRSHTNLRLAACMASGLIYAVCETGFFEAQVWPGRAALSQSLALGSRPLVQASILMFGLSFLRSPESGALTRRAARILAAVLLGLALASFASLELALRIRAFVIPVFGTATLLTLAALAIEGFRTQRRRVLFFVFAWAPSFLSILIGSIAFGEPGFGDASITEDSLFLGLSASFLLFTIFASFDVRQREARLREEILHNVRRFRGFAEIGTDSFWEVDGAGRLTFLSGRTIEPASLKLGDRLADRLEASSSAEYVRPIRETIAGRLPFDDRRIRLTEGEKDVWISISGRAIAGAPAGGGEAVYRGVIRDVTEESEREGRRVVEQQMLALGQLAGSVAHEVNNLIHPIVNLTKRLRNRMKDGDPESKRLMDLIDLSSRQAAKVVSELLRSTRDPRWKEIDRPLSLAVEYSVEAVRPALPASVKIDVVIEPMSGPMVRMGDVLQIVGNLLSNAVHAMEGKGQITVALAAVAEGARLRVSDDGAGMEEGVRQRALQPFFTTKTDGRGTGVGLYVVQKLVRDYGGWITIDSTPCVGTTFTILFPYRKEDDGLIAETLDGARG